MWKLSTLPDDLAVNWLVG